MIPYLNPLEKFIAWIGWHCCKYLGGYDMDNFEQYQEELIGEFPRMYSLVLDYCYIRRAKVVE